MNANALSTKISEVENKISSASGLVKETDYGAIIKGIVEKYFTTADYNRFTRDILDINETYRCWQKTNWSNRKSCTNVRKRK